MRHAAKTKRDRRRWLLPVLAGGVLALAVIGTLSAVSSLKVDNAAQRSAVDMRGNRVALDAGPALTPAVKKAMNVTNATGSYLAVPSVGLKVPLGALNVVDGAISPPGFTSAYLVRDLGVGLSNPGAGTIFVAMHSIRGGGVGPGNYLIDVKTRGARVAVGAVVMVGQLRYTVTGSQTISKNRVASTAAIWQNTPNRLVLLTCLQRANGGPSVDNEVITATRSS